MLDSAQVSPSVIPIEAVVSRSSLAGVSQLRLAPIPLSLTPWIEEKMKRKIVG